jgi:hypothetical protein
MDVRRNLRRVATTTGVALALAVMTATPADARRNLGGTHPADSFCLRPGTVVLTNTAFDNVPCVCYVADGRRFNNLGRGVCPDGLPEIKIERRNVGG